MLSGKLLTILFLDKNGAEKREGEEMNVWFNQKDTHK